MAEEGRLPPIPIEEPQVAFPRQAVDSSAITHVGYDEETGSLYITWKPTGMTYIYLDVPLEEYEAFMNAPSIGQYANRVIKPNYECIPEGLF